MNPHSFSNLDPAPHSPKKLDPAPHKVNADPKHCCHSYCNVHWCKKERQGNGRRILFVKTSHVKVIETSVFCSSPILFIEQSRKNEKNR
jgi:hypothetical protein